MIYLVLVGVGAVAVAWFSCDPLRLWDYIDEGDSFDWFSDDWF